MNDIYYRVSQEWIEKLVSWNAESNFQLYKARCWTFLSSGLLFIVGSTFSIIVRDQIKNPILIAIGYGLGFGCIISYFMLIKHRPCNKFYKDELDYINKLIFEDTVRQEVDELTSE